MPFSRADRRQPGDAPSGRLARLLIILALLLPALMLGLTLVIAWRAAWRNAEDHVRQAAEAAAEYSDRVIASHVMVADRIADAVEGLPEDSIRSSEAAWHIRLQSYLARTGLALDAKLIGADGAILAAAAASPPPNFNFAVREQVTALQGRAPDATWVSRAYPTAVGDRKYFSISRRRIGDDVGTVVVSIDRDKFGVGLARLMAGGREVIAILRADGEVLARHPPLPGLAPPLPPDGPMRRAMAAGLHQGVLTGRLPVTGQEVVIGFRRLEGHEGLYAAVVLPYDSIVQDWFNAARGLWLYGVPAMLALMALAWRVARQHKALLQAAAQLERRVMERSAALADEGQRLALALEAADLGAWEIDVRFGDVRRSTRLREIYGEALDGPTMSRAAWSARVHPEDRVRNDAQRDRLLRGEIDQLQTEYRYQRPDGVWVWLEALGRVVRRDPDTGQAQIFAGVTRDITARKEAEARRDLMLRELDHRAKNILALVQSILQLTAQDDPARFASDVIARIAALSRAQALLSAHGWSGADLRGLLVGELAPFAAPEVSGSDGPSFALAGPPVWLAAQAVQPMILVVHELVSNACRFGALRSPRGRVSLHWQLDRGAGLLRLVWEESGGPAVEPPTAWGVGGKLIRASVQVQLGGHFAQSWRPEGFGCTIDVPLSNTLAEAALT